MGRLRVIPAFKWVVAVFIGEFRTAVHLGWPWVAVVGVALLSLIFAFPDLSTKLTQPERMSAAQEWRAATGLVALYAVVLVAYSSMAVNWHRYLLLKEMPDGWMRLRLDWPVLRYLGNISLIAILVGVIAFIVIGIIFLAIFSLVGNTGLPLSFIMIAAAMIAVVALIYRLSIKLPAIAIEVDDYRFSNAMRDSEGGTLSIIGFAILIGLASTVFLLAGNLPSLFNYAFNLGNGTMMTAAIILAQGLATWASMIFNLTAITLLYAIFAEGAEV